MSLTNLKSIFDKIRKDKVRMSFSANSVNIISKNWSIWIDPSWRIQRDDKYLMSNIDCPYYKDFSSEEEYSKSFHDWCSKIGNQSKIIKNIRVAESVPDLTVETQDGFTINAYIAEEHEYSWYFHDDESSTYYEATGNGVEVENKAVDPTAYRECS